MRHFVRRLAVFAVFVLTIGAAGILASSQLASAGVPQPGGDDVPTWQTGYSWTYVQTFNYNDGAGTVANINENVTYAVQGIENHLGYNSYRVALTGSITGGNGTAQGQSLSSFSGNVVGTAWYRVADNALVELDQTHNLNAKAAGLVAITAQIVLNEIPTSPWRASDYRLHNGDTWQSNTDIAYNGSFTYNAGSFGSGGGPLSGDFLIQAPVSVTSATISAPISGSIATDQVTVNDTNSGVADTSFYAPLYKAVASETQQLPLNGATATLTRNLASASLPAAAKSVTESLSPSTICGGATVNVSGVLNTGQSGQPVSITLDQSSLGVGQAVNASATTGGGGSYSANLVVPNTPDGLAKSGANASWGIVVSTSGATQTAIVEVLPQDCSSIAYTGATSGQQGGSAQVRAVLTDVATGQPVAGQSVSFSLTGQAGTAVGTTDGTGTATATLALAGPPRSATVTATYAGSATLNAATTSSPFTVTTVPTQVGLVSSQPSATVGVDNITYTATVTPQGAAVASPPTGTVTFTIDGSPLGGPVNVASNGTATSQSINTLSIGTHHVIATYSGDGNYGGSTSPTLNQIVHKVLTPTTTAVTSDVNPTVFGQNRNLTATVTANDGGTPTGGVTFFDNGTTVIGTGTLSATPGNDTATLAIDSLAVGPHTITAQYGSDSDFAQSTSAPISQTVQQAGTDTTIQSSDPTPVAGEAITLSVNVAAHAPGAGTPTGTVQIAVDGVNQGGPKNLTGGVASVNVASLNAGPHTISASYSGDTNFTSSGDSAPLTVNKATTTTVLMTSPNPSVTGQAVTLTATVTPNAPSSGTPTGLVTFVEGTTVLGSASLTPTSGGAKASIGLANLALGDHLIVAQYAGDTNDLSSNSNQVDQTVNQAPPVIDTSTALTGSPNPSRFGQAVTFTATVSALSGTNTPTGSVQFSVDGTNLGGPVGLSGGGVAVSPSIASLGAGGHTVIAAYSGDTGFSTSGQVITQKVQQAGTSAVISSNANPAAYGQPLTFTATLTAVAPGAGSPGGTVQFFFDGQPLGNPVGTAGSHATSPTVAVADPGSHSVSIVTSGDANFAGTTASLNQVVNLIPTTTSLTAAPNPVVYAQPLTLTATVSNPPGTGAPTGTVTFKEGTTTLGSGPVSTTGGVTTATLTFSTLTAGTHNLTATYSGDDRFAGSSSSPPTAVTVTKAPTNITGTPAILSVQVSLQGLNLVTVVHILTPPQATLTSNGLPLANKTVTFSSGGQTLCTVTTNSAGVATCNETLPQALVILSNLGYSASFAGDANYQPTSVQNAGLVIK